MTPEAQPLDRMKTPEEHLAEVLNGTHPIIELDEIINYGDEAICRMSRIEEQSSSIWASAPTPRAALLAAISSWQKKGGV
jgi:hypothetical protein